MTTLYASFYYLLPNITITIYLAIYRIVYQNIKHVNQARKLAMCKAIFKIPELKSNFKAASRVAMFECAKKVWSYSSIIHSLSLVTTFLKNFALLLLSERWNLTFLFFFSLWKNHDRIKRKFFVLDIKLTKNGSNDLRVANILDCRRKIALEIEFSLL